MAFGLLQQAPAPLQAQGASGGALVRGSDKHVVERGQAFHHQALLVYRQWHALRLAQGKAVAGVRVAGLFQPDALRGVKQGLGQQVIGVLGAHGDQDFFGQGKHAALGQQAQADLLDQLWHVAEFKVGRPVRQVGARQAVHAAFAKGLRRKQLRVVGAVNKGVGVTAPLVRLGQGALIRERAQHAGRPVGLGVDASAAGQMGRLRRGYRVVAGGHGVRLVSHKDAAARARLNKAVVH